MANNQDKSNRPAIQILIDGNNSMLIFNQNEDPFNTILEQIVRAEAGGPGRKPLSITADRETGQIVVTGSAKEINNYNLRVLEQQEKITQTLVDLKNKLGGEKKG